MRTVVFIVGAPNTGKTSLARALAPVERRIHLDNVCLILAVKRPDLLPPDIAGELPDVDLACVAGKIHRFCDRLRGLGCLPLLVREYVGVLSCRGTVSVVEGYALGLLLAELGAVHRERGQVVATVRLDGGVSIDGRPYDLEQGQEVLRQRLHLPRL